MQSSGGKMEEGFDVPDGKRRGIYTYEAPWTIFGMNWSVRADTKFRLAVGSVIEDFRNKVEIVYLDSSTGMFLSDPSLSFDHPFPPTKLMFIPDTSSSHPDLLATTSDTLRLWHIRDDSDGGGPRVELQCVLLPPLPSDFCSPLTSFDWNDADVRRVCTSSLDTSCTVWDLETSGMVKQLIEHDRVVLDVAWRGGVVDEFASVSADGSLRVFDLRDTRASQIIYESKPSAATPLLRLGWNKQHTFLLATVPMDSAKVVVLDIRYPNLPLWELEGHQAGVNAVSWAPHSARHLCSAGDDAQALIWDVSAMPVDDGGLEPILAYWAGEEVNQLQWSSSNSDWVAIAFANKLQVLRV